MDYRIPEGFIKTDYKDGEVILHTDINKSNEMFKEGINENYKDIQEIVDGTVSVENAKKVDGIEVSKLIDGKLQNTDDKISTSAQVKDFVEASIDDIVFPISAAFYTTSSKLSTTQIIINAASIKSGGKLVNVGDTILSSNAESDGYYGNVIVVEDENITVEYVGHIKGEKGDTVSASWSTIDGDPDDNEALKNKFDHIKWEGTQEEYDNLSSSEKQEYLFYAIVE